MQQNDEVLPSILNLLGSLYVFAAQLSLLNEAHVHAACNRTNGSKCAAGTKRVLHCQTDWEGHLYTFSLKFQSSSDIRRSIGIPCFALLCTTYVRLFLRHT